MNRQATFLLTALATFTSLMPGSLAGVRTPDSLSLLENTLMSLSVKPYHQCEVALSNEQLEKTRPFFHFKTGENPLLQQYDRIKQTVEWRKLVGRTIQVQYDDGSPLLQTVTSFDQLIQADPFLFELSSLVLEKHVEGRSKILHHRVQLIQYLGESPQADELFRFVPGEVAGIGLSHPGGQAVTDPWFGINANSADLGALFQVDIPVPQIVQAFEEAFSSSGNRNPKPGDLATVYLVHTHPAVTAPLNPPDFQAIEKLASQIARKYPGVRVQPVVVAIPTDEHGDVVFLGKLPVILFEE